VALSRPISRFVTAYLCEVGLTIDSITYIPNIPPCLTNSRVG